MSSREKVVVEAYITTGFVGERFRNYFDVMVDAELWNEMSDDERRSFIAVEAWQRFKGDYKVIERSKK